MIARFRWTDGKPPLIEMTTGESPAMWTSNRAHGRAIRREILWDEIMSTAADDLPEVCRMFRRGMQIYTERLTEPPAKSPDPGPSPIISGAIFKASLTKRA
jgi:hypothetical protein